MLQIDDTTRTLRVQVLSLMRDALFAGDPGPGDRINEAHVAAGYGVSRGTVREALRTLEQEGLIVTIPHRGTYVRQLSKEEVEDVYEVRFALEHRAAVRVAARLTPHVIQSLNAHLEVLERAHEKGTFQEQLKADLRFHEIVCEASGSTIILAQWRSLVGLVVAAMHTAGQDAISPLQSPTIHRALVAAIESGEEHRILEVWKAHFDEGMRRISTAAEERALTMRLGSSRGAERET